MDTGETFEVPERVIVSPAVGVYEPSIEMGLVQSGDVIGHVAVAGAGTVPVCSPFGGQLMAVAWSGERVLHRQRIAWLRAAA